MHGSGPFGGSPSPELPSPTPIERTPLLSGVRSGPSSPPSQGGLYTSSSEDGVTWRTPQRLLASAVLPEYRTADYPIDGDGLFAPTAAEHGAHTLSLLIEHQVVLEHGPALRGCVRPPTVCAHTVSLPAAGGPAAAAAELPDATGASAAATNGEALQPDAASPAPPFVLPAPPTRCAGPAALVLRGEAFRWGCSAGALTKQWRAIHSYVALAERLEGEGGCSHFYVAVDNRKCGPAATTLLLEKLGRRLVAFVALTKPPADQGAGVKAALELFKVKATGVLGGQGEYAQLVLGRMDVKLLTPEKAPWACLPGTVCVASKCEAPLDLPIDLPLDLHWISTGSPIDLSSISQVRGARMGRVQVRQRSALPRAESASPRAAALARLEVSP